MMKIKLPLLLVLSGVLLAGCGQDQYFLERQYYKVQKQAEGILKNPEATPPNVLARAVTDLEVFFEKYPKTNVSVDAQFTIVRLYAATKEYDKAHAQIKKMEGFFKGSDIVLSDVGFLDGNVYEDEKKWDAALEEYKKVMKYYAFTPRGVEVPVYIAMRYKQKMQPDKMIQALRDAVAHYKDIVVRYPGTPLSLKCKMMIVQCFIELKEPGNAVNILQLTIDEFKAKTQVESMMLDMAGIYYMHLKDTPKAMEVLKKVVADFSGSKAAKIAEGMIDKINKEKK